MKKLLADFKNLLLSYINLCVVLLVLSGVLLSACGDPTATLAPITTTTPTSSITTPVPNNTNAPTVVTTNGILTTTAAATTTANVTTPGQGKLATSAAVIRKKSGEEVKMVVELAITQSEQNVGLMGRSSLPADNGMLFVFVVSGRYAFWMKDTIMPLSIAFIDANGKIVDIKDMQPLSETTVAPDADYNRALEVPQGYFRQKGILPGDSFVLNK